MYCYVLWSVDHVVVAGVWSSPGSRFVMWWLNQRQEDEAAEGEAAGGGQAGAGSVRRSQRWDEDGVLSCMYYHGVVLSISFVGICCCANCDVIC